MSGKKLQKTIEITIAADGTPSIEAVGFLGTGCKQATAPYEDAMGTVVDRKDKPEMRQSEARTAPDRTVKPGQ
jgi:hypothetical protein